ncbi:hypothetical protein R1flu_015411 [Riccia fluitans]|uniref:Uncharacterized protein n=1 Tax=Riccia fluitans TaxID=41844 RepID=A0ABD1YJ75_9MARC
MIHVESGVGIPPVDSSSKGGASHHNGSHLVFIITIILWDTLFMSMLYFTLHIVYTKYTASSSLQKRWILAVGVLLACGIGPVIAFTVLTHNRLVCLLGIISIVCLIFPVLAFSFALLAWKFLRRFRQTNQAAVAATV